MKQYLELLQDVLTNGVEKRDRTGTGTISVFGRQLRFDLRQGFPLVTTKKVHLRSVIHELLWFLKGDTNTKYLNDNGVRIWDEWATKEDEVVTRELSAPDRVELAIAGGFYKGSYGELLGLLNIKGVELGHVYLDGLGVPNQVNDTVVPKGALGRIYSAQWRDWVGPDGKHHDQISKVIDQLRNDPDSRRIIVSAWNVGELDKMALAPCHNYFQFYTRELTDKERVRWLRDNDFDRYQEYNHHIESIDESEFFDECGVPERELSCFFMMRKQHCAF